MDQEQDDYRDPGSEARTLPPLQLSLIGCAVFVAAALGALVWFYIAVVIPAAAC